jgi:hypothetical protein
MLNMDGMYALARREGIAESLPHQSAARTRELNDHCAWATKELLDEAKKLLRPQKRGAGIVHGIDVGEHGSFEKPFALAVKYLVGGEKQLICYALDATRGSSGQRLCILRAKCTGGQLRTTSFKEIHLPTAEGGLWRDIAIGSQVMLCNSAPGAGIHALKDDESAVEPWLRVSGVHSVGVGRDGRMFMSRITAEFTGISVVEAGAVRDIAGSRELGFLDGSQKTASFCEPTRLCVHGVDNVFVCDVDKLRVVVSPEGCVQFWHTLGDMARAFGIKMKEGGASKPQTLSTIMRAVRGMVRFLEDRHAEATATIGREISTNGPEGTVSNATRKNTARLLWCLERIAGNMSGLVDLEGVWNMRTLLNDFNEHYHSLVRLKADMPSAREFLRAFVPTTRQMLKKVSYTGFFTTTSDRSHYQVPEQSTEFAAVDPLIPKSKTSRARAVDGDRKRLLELATALGSIRQQRPRVRTKPKAGSLPPMVYLIRDRQKNEELVHQIAIDRALASMEQAPRTIMEKGAVVFLDRCKCDALWRARNVLPVAVAILDADLHENDSHCSLQLCTQRAGDTSVHELTPLILSVGQEYVEAVDSLELDEAEETVKISDVLFGLLMGHDEQEEEEEVELRQADGGSEDEAAAPRRSRRRRKESSRLLRNWRARGRGGDE